MLRNLIDELKNLAITKPYLKSNADKIKSHNLPIIIFGAAQFAGYFTDELKNFGVQISGYAVDEEYYKPDKTYLGLPIYNFNELRKTPDKYVFVLGIGRKIDNGKRIKELLRDNEIILYKLFLENVERITIDYIIANQAKFIETYNLLEDDFSQKTIENYLKAHITYDPQYLKDICVSNEYFNDFTSSTIGGSFVDCGAYDGDTVQGFIEFTGENYKKIFAIEPDAQKFVELEKFIREKNYKNVDIFNCGAWNEKGTLTFKSAGNAGSVISENGDIIIATDTIDNIVGDENISLIKMDIEGAELNALKGAVKTLKRCKPILALSSYHKKEDLITLPQFIKNIYGDCKFYLRKHEGFSHLFGLDLYAVPK